MHNGICLGEAYEGHHQEARVGQGLHSMVGGLARQTAVFTHDLWHDHAALQHGLQHTSGVHTRPECQKLSESLSGGTTASELFISTVVIAI